jgi:PAS domain S-box-containing protein
MAMGQSYPLNRYSVKDGLAQSVVNTIIQDQHGLIWFGTQDGISQFDGLEFTNYSTAKGLSHNVVRKIIHGPDYTLWIATDDGLSIFDVENKSFEVYRRPTIPGSRVRGLHRDTEGKFWVGTNNGVVRDPLGEHPMFLTEENGLPSSRVYAIAEDSLHRIWIGTDAGIAVWQDSVVQVYDKSNGLPNQKIRALHVTPQGDIWIGSYADGVTRYSDHQFTHFGTDMGLPPNRVTNITRDQKGKLWMGTDGGGALVYNDQGFDIFDESKGIQDESVSAIYQDLEGNFWFGTFGGGVYKLSVMNILTYTTAHGLISNNVTSLHRTHKGELWVGTNNDGITRLNGDEVSYLTSAEGLPDDRIFVIYESSDHSIWIGTEGGLTRYRNGYLKTWDESDGLTSTSVRTVMEASDGSIWFGTFQGGAYHLKNGKIRPYSTEKTLPNNDVFNIRELKTGEIWVGTDGGISVIHKGELINVITREDGLIDNRVSTLQVGRDSSIWIGTFGGGLSVYKNGEFRNYTTLDGLPNNIISFTLQDQSGSWWIGTKNGVTRYNGNSFSYYNAQNGLPSDEVNQRTGLIDSEGYLWFGTIEGVTRIDPNQRQKNTVKPPVYITKMAVLDQDTTTNSKLTLSHDENYLKFEYLALCYTNPKNVKYKYKLEGLDNRWHTSTNRNIQYTSLAPGDYTFRVIASNNDGIWNYDGDAVSFTIMKPFWQTYWFIGACILFLIGGGFWGIRWREERLQRYNRKLKRLVDEKTGELRRSEQLFRLIMENAGDLITMTDSNGDIEYISPSSIKLLGYRPSELIDKNIRSFIHPEDLRKVSLGNANMIRSNKTRNTEHRIKHRDGSWHTFISTQNVVQNEEDDTSLIIISHDITDRKKAEEELLDAKEKAEAANQAKSSFLANMSHELRTPLNAILGFSQILHRNLNIPTKERDYIQIMYKSGRHLLSMINDILDLSKVEAGRMEINPELIELRSYLGDLQNMFELKARDKGLTLEMHLSDELPDHIKLDAKKLRQILINLISNAIKFTHQGSVSLWVDFADVNGKEMLEFRVKDTGRGISEDEVSEIFSPFKQSKKQFSKGTGLGLSISQHLANLLEGDLTVTSELGVGSTFTLHLPFHEIKKGDEVTNYRQHKRKVDTIEGDAEWTVLVADDVDENRALVTAMLEGVGFTCLEARDGREAIELYDKHHPDFVILDIVMPKVDGREAFTEIRKRDNQVPIIALTASGFANTKQELLDMGFNDYISKPFDEHELFNAISEALDIRFTYLDQEAFEGSDLHANGDKNHRIKKISTLIQNELSSEVKDELKRALEFTDMDSLKELLPELNAHEELAQTLQLAIQDGDYRFLLELDEELERVLS